MPAGRPTKYDPAMCETVIQCGRDGMGKAEMAAELDVAYSTFDLWTQEHPEFSEAVKHAQRLSQAWWEKMGRVSTFGGVDGFNATSYIFQMKNRFRADWNDTLKSEHSGPDGGAIPVEIKRTIIDPKA
jgi:transposase